MLEITSPPADSIQTATFGVKGTKGTDTSSYVLIKMKRPDGSIVTLDKDASSLISVGLNAANFPKGMYTVWLEGEQSKLKSAERRFYMHEKTVTPPPSGNVTVPRSLLLDIEAALQNATIQAQVVAANMAGMKTIMTNIATQADEAQLAAKEMGELHGKLASIINGA